jgi:PAS domain S-box-containing protein/diguanylate cyclase (GGDEF)-like protein
MMKKRILIAEDEIIIAKDLQYVLSGLGYEVLDSITTGGEAIEKAVQLKPDLVLMDIMLKGNIDGIEAVERIKQSIDVPIVYISAYADSATLKRANRTQPFGYLIKPFSESELRTTIELALYKHHIESELKNSEERLKILFEYAPDAYYLNDLNGCLVDGNKAAEMITGYHREELIGKTPLKLNLLPTTQISQAIALLKKNRRGLPTGPDEFILNQKNGKQVNVEVRTYPVKIGSRMLVLGIARDISERIKADAILRESEERYRGLVEKASVAIVINDIDNNITYCNGKFGEIFAYSQEELTHTSMNRLIHKDDLKNTLAYHRNALLSDSTPAKHEFRGIKKDGSIVFLEEYATVLRKGEAIQGFRSYLWDVSARKRAENRLCSLCLIDDLTGLYNRKGMSILLEQQMQISKRIARGFYIICADFDDIVQPNNCRISETTLKAIAVQLKRTYRKSDIVGRIGNSRFAIYAIDAKKDSRKILINRLEARVCNHNRIRGDAVLNSANIVAEYCYPFETYLAVDVLKRIDAAVERQNEPCNPVFPEHTQLRFTDHHRHSPMGGRKDTSAHPPGNDETNLLLIDSNPWNYRLLKETLIKTATPFNLKWATRLNTGIRHLRNTNFDLLFLNMYLIDGSGWKILKEAGRRFSRISIIVYVGCKHSITKKMRETEHIYLIEEKISEMVLEETLRKFLR